MGINPDLRRNHLLSALPPEILARWMSDRGGRSDAAGAGGHIHLLDRPGLESRCCECYAVVKKEYDRLPPEL